MGDKNGKVAGLLLLARNTRFDPHYDAFFACFNQQLFFEAHEVLEALWLKERKQPDDFFYKGLIQLAGAFVHLQKNRLKPACALFQLAQKNLELFVPEHHQLDLVATLALIHAWKSAVEQNQFLLNPLASNPPPFLHPAGWR
ncbi:MAG: DUF309 domain-containing protein [Verrucomicrobiota bacterium]|nr:DUF309 domain-containing protein [Verrucomicrobiota bacterium]